MTIYAHLRAGRERLREASETASLDAEVLLAHVLGVDRSYLFAHGDELLSAEQIARYDGLIARAAAGEPLAYLLGWRPFYDRDILVTPDVLIPRPETELLLERALEFARERGAITAADVGTGSGALAVTLAANVPGAALLAIDVSAAALAVARRNAELHGVADRITFIEGDLLSPVIERGVKLDLVMANLPYIAGDEVPTLAVSRYEPVTALDGGADGLALVRRLLAQLPAVCQPGALVLLEIGSTQGAAAVEAARHSGSRVELAQDYAGLDRMVLIWW